LSIVYAGRWAPVALLMVAGVLYLFRSIYAEVVGALPLNGGAYNALLNTTSKFKASLAACLTVLSYMATAVISANEAVQYVHDQFAVVPVTASTIVLLAAFALLTILGISESSRVATAIFLLHMGTMATLLMAGLVRFAHQGTEVLRVNLETPTPEGLVRSLFFGFSAAMLGISGFESSANFVEEQAEGVFPKTLRNMWAAVTVLNPGMALLALMLVPLDGVAQHEEALLAHMGGLSGGDWLHLLISADAALVLGGAVLTSFVGVNGLVQRMALDRCLPQFLLRRNRRGTTHRIIIGFFILTVSILLITRGRLHALAGVYTLSFLAVMAFFGLGNVLLKIRRARLARPTRASWPGTILAIAAVVAGIFGNARMNPPYLRVFVEYLVPTVLVVSIVLWRISLLRAGLFVVQHLSGWLAGLTGNLTSVIHTWIDRINAQQVVFFTRGDNAANLNNALLYVRRNEHPHKVKIVIAANDANEVPARLEEDLRFLDEVYPDVEIEYVIVEGTFGPSLIRRLSKQWDIPTNLMFIGSPGERFPHSLADLGGVRLII
jgi:amino acid transporter